VGYTSTSQLSAGRERRGQRHAAADSQCEAAGGTGFPWWAGFVSYFIGLLAMLALIVASGEPRLSGAMAARTSWPSWTGGIFGAIFIATAILTGPRLGAATVLALIVALLLSRRQAAPIAYISGSLGMLIGVDLLNLDKVQGLGAPVASIGGAGTFD
jgi:hypothetical protein